MADGENPYQSPNAEASSPRLRVDKHFSIVRGIGYSVIFSPIGFLVPLLFFMLISVTTWLLTDWNTDSPKSLIFDDWDSLISPCVGISVLFAVSAFRNYAPAQQVGFVRSLMHIGGCLIAGVIVESFVTFAFGLENNSYNSDPWLLLKLIVVLAVPFCYVANVMFHESRLTTTDESAG